MNEAVKIYADRGGYYPWRLKAEVDNILRDLKNSSRNTEDEFNKLFYYSLKIFLRSKQPFMYLLVDFPQTFCLFLGMVSDKDNSFTCRYSLKSRGHPSSNILVRNSATVKP